MTAHFINRHQGMIEEAAAKLVAVADDSGESLISVIATMERYIVEKTKVGRQVLPGRRSYTLVNGRLVEVRPATEHPATTTSTTDD